MLSISLTHIWLITRGYIRCEERASEYRLTPFFLNFDIKLFLKWLCNLNNIGFKEIDILVPYLEGTCCHIIDVVLYNRTSFIYFFLIFKITGIKNNFRCLKLPKDWKSRVFYDKSSQSVGEILLIGPFLDSNRCQKIITTLPNFLIS